MQELESSSAPAPVVSVRRSQPTIPAIDSDEEDEPEAEAPPAIDESHPTDLEALESEAIPNQPSCSSAPPNRPILSKKSQRKREEHKDQEVMEQLVAAFKASNTFME